MKRLIAVLLVAASSVAAPSHTMAEKTQTQCVAPSVHNDLVRQTLRFSHVGGNFKANKPSEKRLAKLGEYRSCAKSTDREAYDRMRDFWDRRKDKHDRHAYIDDITIHTGPECSGEYVVPTYIVYRESRCQWNVPNSQGSGAYGWYQLMPGHYDYSYGSRGQCVGLTKSKGDQHICAHRVKVAAARDGLDPWQATS